MNVGVLGELTMSIAVLKHIDMLAHCEGSYVLCSLR